MMFENVKVGDWVYIANFFPGRHSVSVPKSKLLAEVIDVEEAYITFRYKMFSHRKHWTEIKFLELIDDDELMLLKLAGKLDYDSTARITLGDQGQGFR